MYNDMEHNGDLDAMWRIGVRSGMEIVIFAETIRDWVATSANYSQAWQPSTTENMWEAVVLHETLHLFGLNDDHPDHGMIMTTAWWFADASDDWRSLNAIQAMIIQSKSTPGW